MNRKQCRDRALDMCKVPDNYGIGGRDPVALVDMMLQTANQEVQSVIMNLDPALFIRRKRFTYPADTLRVNIDTSLDTASYGSVLKLKSIGILEEDAEPSVTNPVYLIDPYVDQIQRGYGARVVVDGFTSPSGAPATVTGMDWSQAPRMGWRLVNNELELQPTPGQDTYLYAEWVALQILNDDTDLVLGGLVPAAEILVVYRAAELIAGYLGNVGLVQLAHVQYVSASEHLGDLLQRRPDDLGYMNLDPKYR